MRYLLIDHITGWKSGEVISGVKNVAMSEDFLEFHFPKNPVMPGVMLLEALVQLAGWLEAVSTDFREWVLVKEVRKSNFYGFAFPGDQVALEVKSLIGKGSGTRGYAGTGTVNGRKKIKAEFEGESIQLSEIEDVSEQKRLFQLLIRELQL